LEKVTRESDAVEYGMAKRIGILGGISHESTAAYYTRLHHKYYEKYGNHYYPEVVIYSLDFQKFTDMEDQNQTADYIDYILSGIVGLHKAGADYALMSANSPHAVFPEVSARSPVPMLSIVDSTIRRAETLGLKKLLLLGIRFTMRKNFYAGAGLDRGIEVITPTEADQALVNEVIFNELVIGEIKESSRARLLELISGYEVSGVILGCTELPLLMRGGDCQLPLLDTMDLHVEAALDFALAQ
jgi:aspartate racemase